MQIKWAQQRDAGMYECQLSTIPVKSYSVRLNVVGMYIFSLQININIGNCISLNLFYNVQEIFFYLIYFQNSSIQFIDMLVTFLSALQLSHSMLFCQHKNMLMPKKHLKFSFSFIFQSLISCHRREGWKRRETIPNSD